MMLAQGRQVLSFGEKTQYGGESKGLVLETRYGAQVTSPCDGWIEYAGEFEDYGPLLIINAGGGYHVILVGLSHIDVQPGQFVLAAEPVGAMSGWPQQAKAAAPNSAPVLYVELRKDGRPIDPNPWWVAGAATKMKLPNATGAKANEAEEKKVDTASPSLPTCKVWTASYGGQHAFIIKAKADDTVNYTVLDVHKGSEKRELDAYIAAYAKGGEKVGEFSSQTKALSKAFELCPVG